MKLIMKIFEGPDCSGKTTVANEFFKIQNHAIMFHFPILENFDKCILDFETNPKRNPKLAIENLNKTLYNKDYQFNEENLNRIMDDIKNNIISNERNKFDFLEMLEDFFNPKFLNNSLLYTYDKYINFIDTIQQLKLNGVEITDKSKFKTTLMEFRKSKLFDESCEQNFYVIFDRFFLSGRMYNLYAPLQIFKSRCNTTFNSKDSEIQEKIYDFRHDCNNMYNSGENKLLDKLIDISINFNNTFTNLFGYKKFSNETISEICKNWRKIPPTIQMYTHLPSEILYKISMETREKIDEYDLNTELQKIIKRGYSIYCLHINPNVNKLFISPVMRISGYLHMGYKIENNVIDIDKSLYSNDINIKENKTLISYLIASKITSEDEYDDDLWAKLLK